MEPVVQQPRGNWEDKVDCMHAHILGKHEYWYSKHNKTLLNLSGIPEYTATWENSTPHDTSQAVKVVSADIFMVNNETLLCIVGYYSKFL